MKQEPNRVGLRLRPIPANTVVHTPTEEEANELLAMKVYDTKSFIDKATLIHNGKYDYSLAHYTTSETPIKIICPKHGIFEQKPRNHLSGRGCLKCKADAKRTQIYGVGVNDVYGDCSTRSYAMWRGFLDRCYSTSRQISQPTYRDCIVHPDWLYYSNFKHWFENPKNGYLDGYQLDKDILVKGNKMYGPDTCCFVPQRLNLLLRDNRADKGVYKSSPNRYEVRFTIDGVDTILGYYANKEAAVRIAQEFNRERIDVLSKEYYNNNQITQKVYDAIQQQWL